MVGSDHDTIWPGTDAVRNPGDLRMTIKSIDDPLPAGHPQKRDGAAEERRITELEKQLAEANAGAREMMLISQEAIDLIVAEEVSDKHTYEKRYTRPEWPGGGSGVTIGIGYDVGAGVKDKAQLHADWDGHIPELMIKALEPCIGKTGERGNAMLASVRNKVDVPWDAAMAVFDQVDVPRWYNICRGALPNFELLSLDCRGALVSLAYNRGASFSQAGERYREMRNIKAHMVAKDFSLIPGDFRSMKRIWPQHSLRGLVLRREHEARLFEKGLAT